MARGPEMSAAGMAAALAFGCRRLVEEELQEAGGRLSSATFEFHSIPYHVAYGRPHQAHGLFKRLAPRWI